MKPFSAQGWVWLHRSPSHEAIPAKNLRVSSPSAMQCVLRHRSSLCYSWIHLLQLDLSLERLYICTALIIPLHPELSGIPPLLSTRKVNGLSIYLSNLSCPLFVILRMLLHLSTIDWVTTMFQKLCLCCYYTITSHSLVLYGTSGFSWESQ